MARRALAAFVVLGVALADATGDHRVAFYALVAAIPPLAVAAMDAFGEYLVRAGRFREAADLADVLERCPAHLILGGGWLEVEQRVDVSAHAGIVFVEKQSGRPVSSLDRQRSRGVLRQVDERLHGEERRDR